jgi:hypothetical protein
LSMCIYSYAYLIKIILRFHFFFSKSLKNNEKEISSLL